MRATEINFSRPPNGCCQGGYTSLSRGLARARKVSMFFKREISVSAYCKTRLDLLFGENQAQLWLRLKQSWPDYKNLSVSDHLYLAHLRAAHIQILSMIVIKKYASNLDIFIELDKFIDNYLDEHNESYIKELLPLYSKALGSSPIDGILAIAEFMANCIYQDKCSEETILSFRAQLYGAIHSIQADFKEVKLLPNRDVGII